jgi:hypothetical protein
MEIFRYKRVLCPERFFTDFVGDLGVDVPHKNRKEMLKNVRSSIKFAEEWLRKYVAPRKTRLYRNLSLATRETVYLDLIEYEKYLRWNIEYRFDSTVRSLVASSVSLPSVLLSLLFSYLK